MYTDELRAFLHRPLVARMSVIDFDGFPHTVPVSWIMDGDDAIITTVRSTRKVAYIRANPKGSLTIGGDFADEAGYLLKGTYHIEEDPGLEWLRRTSAHYHPGAPDEAERAFAAFAEKDMIILRFKVQKVIQVYEG
ncbi:MAG: pyridoxamine 5'-phosphate oxidase family protein [Anaerolineae bacterium]|nr:pyridoxamine 5'-phosphate oxidase family protein [Anaerolineae bacterium]